MHREQSAGIRIQYQVETHWNARASAAEAIGLTAAGGGE